MFDIKKSGNTKIYIEMLLLKFINDYVNLKTKIVEKNNYVKEINNNVSVTNNNEVTVNEEKINNDNVVENNKDGNNDDVEEKNSMKDSNIEISYNKEEITEENFDNKNPKIINIDAIMKIRVNNTLALANKNLLEDLKIEGKSEQEVKYNNDLSDKDYNKKLKEKAKLQAKKK